MYCFDVSLKKMYQIYYNLRDCRRCVLCKLTVVIDGIGDNGCQCNGIASSLIL